MARRLFLGFLVGAWVSLVLASVGPHSARAGTETIVVDNQPTGDGHRLMIGARPCGINNAAQVPVTAWVYDPSRPPRFYQPVMNPPGGLYIYENGELTEIAEIPGWHEWPPPMPVFYWINEEVALDQQGRIAFSAEAMQIPYDWKEEIFLSNKNGSLTSLTVGDEGVKRTKGQLTIASGFTVEAISNNGKVAFRCRLSDGSEALFVASKGQAKRVAWEDQPAPNGNGALIPDEVLGLDDENRLFFTAEILTPDAQDEEIGIYMGTPGELVEIFRPGRPAPAGDGVFTELYMYGHLGRQICDVNAAGQVAFAASVVRDDGSRYRGVFTASQDGCTEVLRSTDLTPDGQGSIGYPWGIAIADDGTVGVLALGRGFAVLIVSDEGIREIARSWTPAPVEGLVFARIYCPLMSPAGTLTFTADLRDSEGQEQTAIYLFKDGELIQVARDGEDVCPEGTDYYRIVTSDIYVNDSGQVTYAIEAYCDDEPTGGVFLFTP